MSNQTVQSLFEKQASSDPTRTAIIDGGGKITYRELNSNANALASLLYTLGIKQDKVVGMALTSGIQAIITILAIFKAGGIYLPIDLSFGKKRLSDIYSNIGCDLLIINFHDKERCIKELAEFKAKINWIIIIGDKTEILKLEDGCYQPENIELTHLEKPDISIHTDHSNYLFYTSATTGEGKAILGSHKGLHQFIEWEIQEFDIDSNVRVSQLTSLSSDASLKDIFVSLCAGGTLCIPSEAVRNDVTILLEWIAAQKISLIHSVPSVFRLITKELASKQSLVAIQSLKYYLMAGEPLFEQDIYNWRSVVGENVELVNMYGTTETTLAKSFHRLKHEFTGNPSQLIHVGQPITEAFIVIMNNGNLCRIGEVGEVYIKTPYLSKGYYKNELLTQESFVQNPLSNKPDIIYKTGDLGRYLKGRNVEILGRVDNQIKFNGVRLEPIEIEQALLGIPGIRECSVLVIKDHGKQILVAFYVADDFINDYALERLKKDLPTSFIPSSYLKLDTLPLTRNGKADHRGLIQLYRSIKSQADFEAPVNEFEKQLSLIWKQVLNINHIGRNASFFEIGGSSLKSLEVVSMIFKKFNLLVEMEVIFSHRTLKDLASHIQSSLVVDSQQISPRTKRKFYELSHSQKRVWITHQVESLQALYNVPEAYLFEGNLNLGAFNQAIQHLIKRHETLRTSFHIVNGEPMQMVHDYDPYSVALQYSDLRAVDENENMARSILRKESNFNFKLEDGFLCRLTLLRLDEEKYMFIFVIHHIISDAWSIEVLTREVFTFYQAFCDGNAPQLPALTIHYKDYASWHNKYLVSEQANKSKEFWLSEFANNIPLLELPTDYARPAFRTNESDTVSLIINEELKNKLEKYSQSSKGTLFMTVFSVLNFVLYKHTRQTDIIIGTPVSGREHLSLEDQVGYYINTIPIRTYIDPDNTFNEFLKQIINHIHQVFTHQSYPFDKIIEDLKLNVPKNRSPLFDVGFTYIQSALLSASAAPRALLGLDVSYIKSEYNLVKTDIWFKVVNLQGNLIIDIDYNKNLFKDGFIKKLGMEIKLAMDLIVHDAEQPMISLISLIDGKLDMLKLAEKVSRKEKNLAFLKNIIRSEK